MTETLIVRVTQGDLKGRRIITKSGVKYYSFQGVPYAKPPVGILRFKTPQLPDSWEGVHDALAEGEVCPQLDILQTNAYKGNEDSLFLNVYTTELPSKTHKLKKAVMVWFHGGGFGFGSGNTDIHGPDYLMEGDVVLVTVNYRLGPLGFITLPDAGIPGNNGLKDQVMALRWVQQNIVQFGGDPDNVTIFGTSAGGASVQYHLLSPMSTGLFHRAIAISGSALNPWAYDDPETAVMKAFKLGEYLGFKTTDQRELLEFLMKLSAEEIVLGLYHSLTDEDKFLLTIFAVPTCDSKINNGDIFLPDSPHALLKSGKFNDVPYITGITLNEGMLMLKEILAKPQLISWVDKNFDRVLPIHLHTEKKTVEVTQKVKEYYFGNRNFTMETLTNYIEMNTDIQFFNGIHSTLKQHLKFSHSPIYIYQFAFEGKIGLLKQLVGANDIPGVCHGDDTAYLFSPSVLNITLDPNSSEYVTIQRLVKLWTNFAKTGNPTPESNSLVNVEWRPATNLDLYYLNISNELHLDKNLRYGHMTFWETI